MALVLSGSIDISGSMTATTILISSPGAAGMVSSSAQITELAPLMQSTSSINNLTGSLITTSSNNVIAINGLNTYTASIKGATIVSSSQQIQNYFTFAKTGSANTFYGTQTITGSVSMTGSLRVGDWIGGSPHVDETARFDVRTTVDRGIKITGNVSSDVIITAYRGASDDLVRGMRLQANGIGIYIGDGNANTGSSVASFNTNGLAFEAGKGIDFSATSNSSGTTSSELLNDYEEGTFTPTYTGTNITITSYGATYGYYTKVGRLVTLTFCVMTEAVSVVGSEYVNVGGLPFAAANSTEAVNTLNICDSSRWTSTPPVSGQLNPGQSTIQLISNIGNTGAGQDPTRVVSSNMATGAGNRNMVRATITYFTA